MEQQHYNLSPEASTIHHQLKHLLQDVGLDIVHPLCLDWYNNCLPSYASSSRIPTLPPANNHALVLLIGNSKQLWPKFIHACAHNKHLPMEKHPLERYLEDNVNRILHGEILNNNNNNNSHTDDSNNTVNNTTNNNINVRLYWSHSMAQLEGGTMAHVAFQRMAHISGIAWLDETSHLSFHPVYGPWFSLRCCLVFDDVVAFSSCSSHTDNNNTINSSNNTLISSSLPPISPPPPPPALMSNPLSEDAQRAVEQAAKRAFSAAHKQRNDNSTTNTNTTDEDVEDDTSLQIEDVKESWRLWVAIRDAAYENHPYRYSENQIVYHYSGQRNLISTLIQQYYGNE